MNWNPDTPSIVKSRPILKKNQNGILMKLDSPRHFVFVKDDTSFKNKKDLLIGRGAIYQKHRYEFFDKYFNHPLCDLGQTNKDDGNPNWLTPPISLSEHLKYKFILSLQGNDVATNLKWIMSSNSITVMPKPTVESWFMEGTLEGGVHYIEIKPDYSDLEEKLLYYSTNIKEAQYIIHNAHLHVSKFLNKDVEDYTSFKVIDSLYD